MFVKVKEDHVGVLTLKDGTKINYRPFRITRNLTKMFYYTDKGMAELFKPDMTEEEKAAVEELKKLDEKTLIKKGYLAMIPFKDVKGLT